MTKAQQKRIFQRLILLARRGHQTGAPTTTLSRSEQPWCSADMVHQEALYEIQNDLLGLLLSMAQDMDKVAVSHLMAALPWAFTTTGDDQS